MRGKGDAYSALAIPMLKLTYLLPTFIAMNLIENEVRRFPTKLDPAYFASELEHDISL